jgi:peptidyl-prolyl cis-trans isomerase B (cyclophilin B)
MSQSQNQLSVDEMKKMTAVIETNFGTIKFKFFPEKAPGHARNFISLAQKGFYNNVIFHRVIKGFMVQGGDPKGTGSGGPGYTIKAEFNDLPHLKGTVSMARTNDPNSAGSQFFICLDRKEFLDGQYSVFGQVTEGQDIVDKIGSLPTRNDRPVSDAVMKKVYIETAK